MSLTYSRHVASVEWRRAGASARGEEGEKLDRAHERAEREAVGPAAPARFF